jgi:hypothetical protein
MPTPRKKIKIEECILTEIYLLKWKVMVWSVGRDLTALLKYFKPPSVISQHLERRIMYSNIDLPQKGAVDGVECWK